MSSDELRSAEKRAEDALLEKENMNKSMTPREVKAISTTCVSTDPSNPVLSSCYMGVGAGFSLRLGKSSANDFWQVHLRQMQAVQGLLLTSPDEIC